MRCPSCSAEVPDDSAFCPRCGVSLALEEVAGTATIPAFRSRVWVDATAAAAMSWLALLCIAAVLLLAPKLQYPAFAKGANPVDIFTGMVMVALGILRVPLHIGKLTIAALPLGALIAVAVTTAWATASAFEARPPQGPVWRTALKVAALFSLIAALLALIFRFRGDEPAWAGAWGALLWGFVWSLLFTALGLKRGQEKWRAAIPRLLGSLRAGSENVRDGMTGGGFMIGTAFVGATAALLLWIIAALAKEAPYGGFGLGDAGAAILYLGAFLPNIIVALIALSIGAPVFRGAQVGIGGRRIGGLEEISLLQWPGGVPWYAFLLLAIPVGACLLGGYWIGRRSKSGEVWKSLVAAAVSFGLVLALLGWLGEARVGAGLVEQRGFARVAISPIKTFLWAVLWSVICGWLGSELALRKSRMRKDVTSGV